MPKYFNFESPNTILNILVCIALIGETSCRSRSTPQEESDLTEIVYSMPNNKSTDGKLIYDAWSIEIATSDAACKESELTKAYSTQFDDNGKAPKSRDPQKPKIKNACDYTLLLKLGNKNDLEVTPKGKRIANPLYWNVRKDSPNGLKITKEMLTSANGLLDLKITVYKVNDSSPELPPQLDPDSDTNILIDVKIQN